MEWEPKNPYEALEYMSDGKLINVAFRHGVKETAKKLVEHIEHIKGAGYSNEACFYITEAKWQELRRQVGLE